MKIVVMFKLHRSSILFSFWAYSVSGFIITLVFMKC